MGKDIGNIPVLTPARSKVAVKREALYAAGSRLYPPQGSAGSGGGCMVFLLHRGGETLVKFYVSFLPLQGNPSQGSTQTHLSVFLQDWGWYFACIKKMYTSNPLAGLAEVPSLLDQKHCGKGEFGLSPTLQWPGDGWSGPKSQQSQACACLCLPCPYSGLSSWQPKCSIPPAHPCFVHHPCPGLVAEQALHHPGHPSAMGTAPELSAWQHKEATRQQRSWVSRLMLSWCTITDDQTYQFSYACKSALKILLAKNHMFM